LTVAAALQSHGRLCKGGPDGQPEALRRASSCARSAGRLSLTQKAFADKLSVSLPYLNQMENNHRPSRRGGAGAGAGIRPRRHRADHRRSERLVTDMREALADPVFTGHPARWPTCGWRPRTPRRWPAPSSTCTAPTARPTNASPRWTRRWGARTLPCALALGRGARLLSLLRQLPRCHRPRGGTFATAPQPAENIDRNWPQDLAARGHQLHYSDTAPLRHYDPQARGWTSVARGQAPSQRFQLLHQVALLTQNDLLEATLDLAGFPRPKRATSPRSAWPTTSPGRPCCPTAPS
jgi:XRE family transcriptional regulator, fatty acid utilization regulator